MASGEFYDPVLWANILAGSALIFYAFVMWLQVRGYWVPSPRLIKIIRWTCFILLLMPIAARYHYDSKSILYLSAAIFMVGFLLKLKRWLGI